MIPFESLGIRRASDINPLIDIMISATLLTILYQAVLSPRSTQRLADRIVQCRGRLRQTPA